MQSGSAREERRDWEDCADALTLLLLLSSSSPRSQTHTTRTHLQARSPRSTPTCCRSPCAIGDSLQRTQRQGVEAGGEWREIEAEEEDEEEDVCDEGGKERRKNRER